MGRNKSSQKYRHKSFRLEKEVLQGFQLLCATYGIKFSTGLRWLIEEAIQQNTLKPFKRKESPSQTTKTGDDSLLPKMQPGDKEAGKE